MNTATTVPSTWTTGTTEAIKTGTWRAALPHYVRAPSPCHLACPVNGDIAEWIGLAAAGDLRAAWDVLTRHNPFPAVAGRICHHPCEAACNRAGYDESLAICKLERAVGDAALAQGWAFARPATERSGHVAIVGAGPSGLSAAFQLRRRGWRVTIYEAQCEPGGLMRYGIPSYRLARAVVDDEIARIVALGVKIRCGHTFASAQDFERLRNSHDAVYLAVGARRQKRLSQLPAQAPWLMDGAQYLACVNDGAPPALGTRLVVVGGGSAALDVARSARRAGHEVTILALESAAQMPAQREELAEALEEGITLVDGAMLTAAASQPGAGLTLACVRVRFEPGPVRGRFSVSPLAGTEFALAADALVTAIGQDPDLTPFSTWLPLDGSVLAADAQQATGADHVWAGGDVASLARFVTEAIGMGKRAALAIDRSLGGDGAEPETMPAAAVGLARIATFYHPPRERVAEARRPAAERLTSGLEVQLGLEFEQALAEAARCFSCGTCTHCDNCFHHCPDLAIRRASHAEGSGYVVLTDYCKGCGICVRECPSGAMTMCEELK
jgi:NADPH-dependent glutamate synthase beta subunit-like oxidoreductase